ncbi:heme exporter protein CcmD [Teredinibacter sp. KSP-S5-2]|uniref:heme exporter protein CcmD n=1 Tax=Teredinibacter sp. KSP-S5-2 TaxID=3034506 RepID=UPI0029345BCB|nr:heme exporter protein CcmD [Teredinibacter sp. KSP-S5-2]WNO07705.1 heme exporter protein CcmD [Teredinibacter sp. KSP-S5-2]
MIDVITNLVFQFHSLSDLLTMKGHGFYVWVSYLATFLGLGYLAIQPKIKTKTFFKQQRAIQARLATTSTPEN